MNQIEKRLVDLIDGPSIPKQFKKKIYYFSVFTPIFYSLLILKKFDVCVKRRVFFITH